MQRINIRDKDEQIADVAARLRANAEELEQLCDLPSHMPPAPRAPRLSLGQSLRAKKVSLPAAAGGWILLTAELVVRLLEHFR